MATATSALGAWLQTPPTRHNLNQLTAAVQIGVGVGTINQLIRLGHTSRIDTLFRIADHFGTPRERVLHLAANLPPDPAGPDPEDDYLIQELIEEFRRIPDEWKPEVLAQVRTFVRLSTLPTHRFIGEDPPNPDPGARP